MIRIVFLDAGETILHPHPSFPELFATVCTRSGHRVSVDEVGALQQRLAPHLVDLGDGAGVELPSLSAEGSRRFWTHLYRRLLGELGIEDEELVAQLYATFSDVASYRLFEDALPAMRALGEAGYRIGLISNFEEWLEEMLVELEVGELFEVRIISGLEGIEKPDPAIYRLAARRAGVDPSEAVHVGDSPALDIEPAAAIGMTPVLIDRLGRYQDLTYNRIESLQDLAPLIPNL